MAEKTLYLIAGADGCGKTTYAKNLLSLKEFENFPFVCLEEQILLVDSKIESYAERKKKAAENCKQILANLVTAKESFIYENALGLREDFVGLESFRKCGYVIRAVYIATSRPVINERRISKRMEQSGEPKMTKEANELYRRSMRNIKQLISFCDEVLIYDGSDNELRKVYSKQDNGTEWVDVRYKEISWVQEFIPDSL